MNELKIEKGVPMPEERNRGIVATMRKCEVGDSFVVESGSRTLFPTLAKYAGIKIRQQKIAWNQWRIWRIA